MGGIGLVGLGGCAVAHYALGVEPRELQVSMVKLAAPCRSTLRLAFLSDIHLGPYVDQTWVHHVVNVVNGLKPDVVMLGGDYVTGSTQGISALVTELAALHADLGVLAVLGNHDYWVDPVAVTEGLRSAGIRVLVNNGVELLTSAGPLYVAGLDDAWNGRPDLTQAMAAHRVGVPAILLQHEPDPAGERADDERLTLQLAGHTHGGQVRLPGIGAIVLPPYGKRYAAGLYELGRSRLYVTRGIGVTAPPVRLNCLPEVTLVMLSPESEHAE